MIEVPVIRDFSGVVLPAFEVGVDLLGASFLLSFHWNARAESWVFGLSSEDGTPLLAGVAVRSRSLLYKFVLPGFPLGLFYVLDTGVVGEDPGRLDLGSRVRVVFLEPDEL